MSDQSTDPNKKLTLPPLAIKGENFKNMEQVKPPDFKRKRHYDRKQQEKKDSVTAVDHNKSNLLNISKITENKNISKTMVQRKNEKYEQKQSQKNLDTNLRFEAIEKELTDFKKEMKEEISNMKKEYVTKNDLETAMNLQFNKIKELVNTVVQKNNENSQQSLQGQNPGLIEAAQPSLASSQENSHQPLQLQNLSQNEAVQHSLASSQKNPLEQVDNDK